MFVGDRTTASTSLAGAAAVVKTKSYGPEVVLFVSGYSVLQLDFSVTCHPAYVISRLYLSQLKLVLDYYCHHPFLVTEGTLPLEAVCH